MFGSRDADGINFLADLIKHNSVMWFAKLGGKWDYVIEFFAKNAKEFDDLLDEIITNFPGGFTELDIDKRN